MKHSKPTLTLFTDASLTKTTAGWAGWAIADGRPQVTHSGPATLSKSSTVVELEAIARMLLVLATTQYLKASDRSILIQSDSLYGLEALRFCLSNSFPSNRDTGASLKKTRRPTKEEEPWCTATAVITSHCDVVYLRHVRAHKGNASNRSQVNELVDRLAKEAAR